MSFPTKTTYKRLSQFRSPKEKNRILGEIEHISFNEARRLKEPIYRVLIKELYEEGCTMAGDYFTCLVLKERRLYAQFIIRNWVKNDEELLLKLHRNVMTAEKAAKVSKCGGMVACLKILHQSLLLLNCYADTYGWLLNDLWDLFVDIAEKHDGGQEDRKCDEIRSRLYVDYGVHLSKRAENLEKSVGYFLKSLGLCRGELWPAHAGGSAADAPHDGLATLHDHVAVQFAKALIRYGEAFLSANPVLGIELVHKAIVALFEVTHADTKVLVGEAFVMKIHLLIDQKHFKKALANIEMVHRHTPPGAADSEYAHVSCDLFQQKGFCHQQLQDYPLALVKYKQALLISRKFNLRHQEGLALLHIGKLYAMYPDGNGKAMEALQRAKVIFSELGEVWNMKRSDYALAQIRLIFICPELVKLIKSSSTFCGLYQMRQWKYMKKPSWKNVEPATDGEEDPADPARGSQDEVKAEPAEKNEGEKEQETEKEREVDNRSFKAYRLTFDRSLALDEVEVSEEDMFRIEDNWTEIESKLMDNENPEDCMWN